MPAVVPPISTVKDEPALNVTAPVLRMPGLGVPPGVSPGSMAALAMTVPLMVPLPPRVPPLTVKALAAAVGPSTRSVPALTVVAPV